MVQSAPSAAPLPGVLVLTTTPPLHCPSLLLSSHIRHPLKQQYPQLVASQWSSYLASKGLQPCPQRADPVVWLKSLPSFPPQGLYDDEGDADVSDSQSNDEAASDDEDDEDDTQDEEDDDGNIWRGSTPQHRRGPLSSSLNKISDASGTAIANLTVGQVTYLAPIPQGGNPVLSLAFLHHLHTVIAQYFPSTAASSWSTSTLQSLPSVPASVLASNFDVIYQILQEMLDDGRPLTTEYNSIKGIVRGKAWWEDITSKMASFTSSTPAPPPQISPLPWRGSNVRHTRNEIYVDIVESLSCVVDRKGRLVAGLPPSLAVSIGCKAKLSGTPDLTLALHPSPVSSTSGILAPSFHPCVRHRRWVREGVLSFVPPEGDFELASMAIENGAATSSGIMASKAGSVGLDQIPFAVKASRQTVKETKGRECTFEIRLTSKAARMAGNSSSGGPSASEAIEVTFSVGPGQISSLASSTASSSAAATAASLVAEEADVSDGLGSINVDARAAVSSVNSLSSGSGRGAGASRGVAGGALSLSSSGAGATSSSGGDDAGSWTFDARQGLVRWSIPRLGGHAGGPSEVTLKGKVTAASGGGASFSSSVMTTYSLPAGSPSLSGLRVASLEVGGVEYKPFKGVRGATRGRVEWRW